jgi:hypothetical protein
MDFPTRKRLLAERATLLKKAWLMAAAWAGAPLKADERSIPDYSLWVTQRIAKHVKLLDRDLDVMLRQVVRDPKAARDRGIVTWLGGELDAFPGFRIGLKTLCTASDFESRFGPLRARDAIDVPPYAELLLQGWYGLAIRHPEYMLARDLQFLYSLFLTAERLIVTEESKHRQDKKPSNMPAWARSGSENVQALARAVIQTSFNLIESFVSGLARARAADPSVSQAERATLVDNRASLRKRVLTVPRLITGRPLPFDQKLDPFATLFDDIKVRRDAFVHCEPGPQLARQGHVKEVLFHDVSPPMVRKTVECTDRLIRMLWAFVHEAEGPRWLPALAQSPERASDLTLCVPTAPHPLEP